MKYCRIFLKCKFDQVFSAQNVSIAFQLLPSQSLKVPCKSPFFSVCSLKFSIRLYISCFSHFNMLAVPSCTWLLPDWRPSLVRARHRSNCSTQINSLSPYHHPLNYSHFTDGGNHMLNVLPRVMQLTSCTAGCVS